MTNSKTRKEILETQREKLREDLQRVMVRWADINQIIRSLEKVRTLYIEESKPIAAHIAVLDKELQNLADAHG